MYEQCDHIWSKSTSDFTDHKYNSLEKRFSSIIIYIKVLTAFSKCKRESNMKFEKQYWLYKIFDDII